jgi:hypothetical protein
MWEMRNTYEIFDVKDEGKRPVGRLRHRWKNNIKSHLSAR